MFLVWQRDCRGPETIVNEKVTDITCVIVRLFAITYSWSWNQKRLLMTGNRQRDVALVLKSEWECQWSSR